MMTRKIQMADVVRAHMEVRGCPVLTSNQCYAIAMNLNCQIGSPTPPQPIYDEEAERQLFEDAMLIDSEEAGFGEPDLYRDSEGLYRQPYHQAAWGGWIRCAQSRAKSVEVGHE